MPLSSIEIAQMNGAFQGMAYNSMAYSNMIGQGPIYGGGMQGGTRSDAIAGNAMNRAAAIGAPVAMGAMGVMGLDPMSLGARAGLGAYGAGLGFGGSMAVGAGAMLPAMVGMEAVRYAGNQMYEGAQQQLGLNNTLRQSFGFRNQQGGQGFTRNDMGQIGGVIREMSHQFGPGGEIAGFGELSQLAGKMGQMGFATGIRDVQEFSKRFKEMVSTLKTMAKDLGTTLEGAMEFAQAAKGSGVFGMRGAASFASMVKQGAASGTLAVSELTGAASVGAQVSRSIGGLGVHGMMGGMRSMMQVGTAVDMGVLTENDIYNVTGQTGAEGRQAYVQNGLSKAGRWLSGGRGRRLLASLASEDGQLDSGAVQKLLSGGMNIQQTIAEGGRMKRDVGRANFIYNEGRLRGAALGELGMYAPAMQMMEWMGGKGITVDQLDPRSMLGMQRQLGWGRDEVEQAVKMVQNMPQLLQKQAMDKENTDYLTRFSADRKTKGIEGMKTRFDQAKEHVNSRLQETGQRVLNDASEMVDRFIGELSDQYIAVSTDTLDGAVRSFSATGSGDSHAMQRLFGKGFAGVQGFHSNNGRTLDDLTRGGTSSLLSASRVFRGQSDASKFRVAGYDIEGDAQRLLDVHAGANSTSGADFLSENDAIQGAVNKAKRFHEGANVTNEEYLGIGRKFSGAVKDLYLGSDISTMRGEDRAKAFSNRLLSRSSIDLRKEYDKIPESQKATFINSLEVAADIPMSARLSNMSGLPDMKGFDQNFATEGQRNEAYGNALLNKTSWTQGRGGRALQDAALGAGTGALIGSTVGPVGTVAGAVVGGVVGAGVGYLGHGEEMAGRAGVGKYLASKEGIETTQGLFLSGEAEAKRTRDRLEGELIALKSEGRENSSEGMARSRLLAAAEYAQASSGGVRISDKDTRSIVSRYSQYGISSREDLEAAYAGVRKVYNDVTGKESKAEMDRMRGRYSTTLKEMNAAGLTTKRSETDPNQYGVFTRDAAGHYHMSAEAMGKNKLSQQAQDYLVAAASEAGFGEHVGIGSEADQAAASVGYLEATKRKNALGQHLSMEDLRGIRGAAGGTAIGRGAASQLAIAERIKGAKGYAGGSGAGLGISLSMAERRKLKGDDAGLADTLTGRLAGDDVSAEARKDIRAQILAYQQDVKSNHFSEAASKAQTLLARKDIQDHQTAERHKGEEAHDPVASEMRDHLKILAEASKTGITVVVKNYEQLRTPKDAEDTNFPGAPQPGAK